MADNERAGYSQQLGNATLRCIGETIGVAMACGTSHSELAKGWLLCCPRYIVDAALLFTRAAIQPHATARKYRMSLFFFL